MSPMNSMDPMNPMNPMNNDETVMTDSELLVQRFLDQELSPEARVRFLVRIGRDEALRQRLLELEQIMVDVSRLPRPTVPDGFVARVMERTVRAVPAPSIWRRLAVTLWAPHIFRWNLASAATCLALLIAAAAVVGGGLARQRAAAPPAADGPESTAAAASSTVLVRLVVLQPDARTVQAAGDFNAWNPSRTPLEQVSSGVWAVTIPLQPGRYQYMLVVDGEQWIADPFAAEQSDDGFGSRNAVIDVRPIGASL